MLEPFIGQIKIIGFDFAPRGWALCNGQILSVDQNQSLYSLLGTFYGGDGRTTFALPDLRGRTGVHEGKGIDLNPIALGQKGGINQPHVYNLPRVKVKGPSAAGGNVSVVTSATATAPIREKAHSPYQAVHYIIALEGRFPSRN